MAEERTATSSPLVHSQTNASFSSASASGQMRSGAGNRVGVISFWGAGNRSSISLIDLAGLAGGRTTNHGGISQLPSFNARREEALAPKSSGRSGSFGQKMELMGL